MAKSEPSIFDQVDEIDPKADARRLAAAEADIAAQRLTPNAKVIEWLKTWDTPGRKPAPYSWRKQSGPTPLSAIWTGSAPTSRNSVPLLPSVWRLGWSPSP
jgi:hypothetical protein